MIVKLRGEIICQGISEHRWHPNIALTQPHSGFNKYLGPSQQIYDHGEYGVFDSGGLDTDHAHFL